MLRVILWTFLLMSLISGCAQPNPQSSQLTPGNISPAPGIGRQETSTSSPAPTNSPSPTLTQEPANPTDSPSESPTAEPETLSSWIVYTGMDENLWLVDPAASQNIPLTQDALSIQSSLESGEPAIRYCCAQWSPDGEKLIFQRETGKPHAQGFDYSFDLLLYDIATGETTLLIKNDQINGFSWRPGSSTVAFGSPIPIEYFLNRSPDVTLGIWAVDTETGNTFELVKPERGYTLGNPHWSTDGRFLAFEEVQGMEGRGLFAYYDFDEQEYIAWEEVIGSYHWSPDSEELAYDQMAYTPIGGERIWLRDLQESEGQPVSAQLDPGYAFSPQFSPAGDRLAYLAELNAPDSQEISIFVQEVPNGEPLNLGTFTQARDLSWNPDGSALLLSMGDYDHRQVIFLDSVTGESRTLTAGDQASWQPTTGP